MANERGDRMLWASWEDIREKMEEEIAKLDIYESEYQTFLTDNKAELECALHKALTLSLARAETEEIDDSEARVDGE